MCRTGEGESRTKPKLLEERESGLVRTTWSVEAYPIPTCLLWKLNSVNNIRHEGLDHDAANCVRFQILYKDDNRLGLHTVVLFSWCQSGLVDFVFCNK